jgi:hypothetical protein
MNHIHNCFCDVPSLNEKCTSEGVSDGKESLHKPVIPYACDFMCQI